MTNKEPCLLWENAKDLAKDKGLTMRGECPVNQLCIGETCIYIAPPGEFGPQQLEKFITRLEKHFQIEDAKKLEALREELIREG